MARSIGALEAKHDSAQSQPRWLLLACIVIIWFTTYFVRLAWVNVAASANQTLGSSATEMSSFITFFFIGYVLANITGGFLVDRLGARRVITTALWCLSLTTLCFSQIGTAAQGWTVQFAMGLSCGCFYAAVIKLVAAWFTPLERGTASGLLFVAGPFAVIMANLIYPSVINTFNWTTLYVLLGTYVALIAIVAMFLIHNGSLSPSATVSAPVILPAGRQHSLFNINLFLLCGACFGTGWGTWGFTFCSNLLLVRGNFGFSQGAAATVALCFGMGGVVIIPVYGLLSDRFTAMRPQLYIAALVLMVAALFYFSAQSTLVGFSVAAFLLGMAAYAFLPVLGAMLPDLVLPGTLGATAGITNAAGQLAAALAPLVIGIIIDRSHSVTLSLSTLAVGPAFGAACLITLLLIKRRSRLSAGRLLMADSAAPLAFNLSPLEDQ